MITPSSVTVFVNYQLSTVIIPLHNLK